MKILKTIVIFCSLSFFHPCLGKDLSVMKQDIDALGQKIEKNIDDSKVLFQIDKSLQNYAPILKNCINKESEEVIRYSKQAMSLKSYSGVKLGSDEKNSLLRLLQEHQDNQAYCQYLIDKINNYQDKINQFKQMSFQKNFFLKEKSFIQVLAEQPRVEKKSPPRYAIKNYIQSSNFELSFEIIIISFFVLVLFRYLPSTKRLKLDYLNKISLSKYLQSVLIYFVLAPVQFLVLKTVFSHQNLFLLSFLHRNIVQLMVFTVIFYFYQFYQSSIKTRDILLILLQMTLFSLANGLCYEYNFLELNDFPLIDLLTIKYMILLCLQPLLCLVIYWSFVKLLNIKIFPHLGTMFLVIFSTLIFTLGLFGYLNLAINIDFVIMIDTIFLLWIFIFNRVKNAGLMALNQPGKSFNHFLDYFFKDYKNLAVNNLKIILITFFVGSIIYSMVPIISLSILFLPESFSKNLYNLLFMSQEIGFFNFRLIQVVQSIYITLILNMINLTVSSFISNRIFLDKSSRHKTFKVFHCFGYFIIALIILEFLGFELKNFILLFGGLSIGLGLGLKDIFSSFISSIFLFINPPYRVGDYVEIANTKGYVKKITLLETIVETFDNNTLIYPNRIVASSVIQNYNYANKSFHKVHITYVLSNFDIQDEEIIKKKLLSIIIKDDYILNEEHYEPSFIFSLIPKTKDAFYLEVIFCLKNLEGFQEKITRINRVIYNQLQSMKLEVDFEDMKYPFK